MKHKYVGIVVLIVLRLLVLALFISLWFLPLAVCRKCDGNIDDVRELCTVLFRRVPDSRLILLDEQLQGAFTRDDLLTDNPKLTFGLMLDDTACFVAKLHGIPGLKVNWAITRSHGSICFTASSGRRVKAKLVTLFHAGAKVKPLSMLQFKRALPRTEYLPLQWLSLGETKFLAPSHPSAVLKARFRGDQGLWDEEGLLQQRTR